MANSENDGKRPGQGMEREGDAGQPFEGQGEQPGQFTWRQGYPAPDARAQSEVNPSPDAWRSSGQAGETVEAPGPLGQTLPGSEPARPQYPASAGEYPVSDTQPGERAGSYWRNEAHPVQDENVAETHWREGSRSANSPYTEGTPQPTESSAGRLDVGPRAPAPDSPGRRANFLVGALTGALLCLLLGGLVGWQLGKHNNTTSQKPDLIGYKNGAMTPEQIIAQDRQAVVQINVKMAQGAGVGSGVIIDSSGNIITNDHVVSGGQAYNVVLFDGTSLPAKLVGVDTADDLAVVRITPPSKMYVMPVGDSAKLEVGNGVLAIGNPLGITQTVTQGIVSALGRTVNEGKGGGVIVDAVQTDAPINPGNSGGALVSLNGDLVGIPTLVAIDPEFKTPANGVGFAIPSNRVKFIAPQLIQYGKVIHSGRAALQASVATVDPLVAAQAGLAVDHGVLIVGTTPNGAAANAGLRAGDVITQINNQTIDNVSDLSDALLSYDPGTAVTVNYMRGTQQQQARVKLGELAVS